MLVGLGSIALDTTRTPFKTVIDVLGGSGSYFSLASSFFTEMGLIAVIGDDFPEEYMKLFTSRIDTSGLAVKPGKTFRFDSSFGYDLGARTTNKTELNVFGGWKPEVPDVYLDAKYLYLGILLLRPLRWSCYSPQHFHHIIYLRCESPHHS